MPTTSSPNNSYAKLNGPLQKHTSPPTNNITVNSTDSSLNSLSIYCTEDTNNEKSSAYNQQFHILFSHDYIFSPNAALPHYLASHIKHENDKDSLIGIEGDLNFRKETPSLSSYNPIWPSAKLFPPITQILH